MEGVMMRNGEKYAVAVRTQNKEIAVKADEYHSFIHNPSLQKLPIVRGALNFIDSLVLGMKSLMYSADFFAEESDADMKERHEQEEKKARKKAEALTARGREKEGAELLEKTLSRIEKERGEAQKRAEGAPEEKKEDNSLLMGLTIAFSVVLSIGLFMLVPYLVSRGLKAIGGSETFVTLMEAVIRMLIFFAYMFLISRMKDIQRTFMYHGAEHKCINCIEHGMELNVENVRKSSRQHKRCGTSFLLIVMVISVLFQLFFVFVHITTPVWRIGIRLLMIPFIAGVAFEFIRLAGKYDNMLVNVLSAPGLCLQRLTTKEPTDDQIEVGIASVEAVFNWKKYLNENFGAQYDLTQEADPDNIQKEEGA